jgi:hypothetical protein
MSMSVYLAVGHHQHMSVVKQLSDVDRSAFYIHWDFLPRTSIIISSKAA